MAATGSSREAKKQQAQPKEAAEATKLQRLVATWMQAGGETAQSQLSAVFHVCFVPSLRRKQKSVYIFSMH